MLQSADYTHEICFDFPYLISVTGLCFGIGSVLCSPSITDISNGFSRLICLNNIVPLFLRTVHSVFNNYAYCYLGERYIMLLYLCCTVNISLAPENTDIVYL